MLCIRSSLHSADVNASVRPQDDPPGVSGQWNTRIRPPDLSLLALLRHLRFMSALDVTPDDVQHGSDGTAGTGNRRSADTQLIQLRMGNGQQQAGIGCIMNTETAVSCDKV